MGAQRTSELRKCSFCGKSEKQVYRIISGPHVHICNECVYLCVDIIEGRGPAERAEKPSLADQLEALEARVRELEGRSQHEA